MTDKNSFDIIIIGGSYTGLSAAMALGRSLRRVLIIDSGNPCNAQTPHSHNLITHDGATPKEIAEEARLQVLKYNTVKFYSGLVTEGVRVDNGFEITTESGESFNSKKLLFATGVKDLFPDIKGIAACWGISVLHCPYCHGYEVKHKNLGLLANGDVAFELCKLISNWSKQLTLFTNGKSTLTTEQIQKLKSHDIDIVEKEILFLDHLNGYINEIVFTDNSKEKVDAIFTRLAFKQHCEIPENLGCEFTEQGYTKVDDFYRTTIGGVYAAGDNTIMGRSVALAIAAGNKAGAFINKDLIEERF